MLHYRNYNNYEVFFLYDKVIRTYLICAFMSTLAHDVSFIVVIHSILITFPAYNLCSFAPKTERFISIVVVMQVTNLNLDKPNSVKDGDSKSDDGSEEQISLAEKSLLQKIIRKGLVETTKDVEIQRKDPNSPLYSIKSFDALHLLVTNHNF